jgi:RNA polymerase sigma factor (sigma-70 family)
VPRDVTDADVARHFPLVAVIIRRMHARGQLAEHLESEDIEAVGRFAVWRALCRWDASKGTQSTFITAYVEGSIRNYQRDVTKPDGWHRKHGRIARIGSLDAPVTDDGRTLLDLLAEDQVDDDDALAARELLAAAARLPERECLVAAQLLSGAPLAHAAARLNVRQQQVSKIARRVRDQLAEVL